MLNSIWGWTVPDPVYLTDAERPLRTIDVRDRYRHFAVFRLKGIQYTRWFQDAIIREHYCAHHQVQVMNLGMVKTCAELAHEQAIFETAFNKTRNATPHVEDNPFENS